MLQAYRTIQREASDVFVERRSRFIGHIRPVQTESEALAFVAEKKKEYWDATHNVYAYVLRDGGIRRYSDDGEPQGTAGMTDRLRGGGHPVFRWDPAGRRGTDSGVFSRGKAGGGCGYSLGYASL